MASHYFVYREHSLVYRCDDWGPRPLFYGVLASSILRGGFSPMTGVCCPDEQDLRPANLDDFRDLRVVPPPFRIETDGSLTWDPDRP